MLIFIEDLRSIPGDLAISRELRWELEKLNSQMYIAGRPVPSKMELPVRYSRSLRAVPRCSGSEE
jgi:hypothetical protein